MEEEMISRLNRMLASEDRGDRDLGVELVRNHIHNHRETSTEIRQGARHLVTVLVMDRNPMFIMRYVLRYSGSIKGKAATRRRFLRSHHGMLVNRNVISIKPYD